jgi:D-alanyl-D-alanine carboxypeptidase
MKNGDSPEKKGNLKKPGEAPEARIYHSLTEFEYNRIRQRNRNTLLGMNIGVGGF